MLSDPIDLGARGIRPPRCDFDLAIDGELWPWVRNFGAADQPYEALASGDGVSLRVVEDVTLGLDHRVQVHVKMSDPDQARWSCSCTVSSRGAMTENQARESAEVHAAAGAAANLGRRPVDTAVAQGADGRWSQRQIRVARRIRVSVCSDLSRVRVHQRGLGEDFELIVDGTLDLWVRRLGVDDALRRDESGRGVSLMVLDSL